jgi:hypothetical protein
MLHICLINYYIPRQGVKSFIYIYSLISNIEDIIGSLIRILVDTFVALYTKPGNTL